MFFKNLKIYRLGAFDLSAAALSEALSKFPYQEGQAVESGTMGWVDPCSHSSHGVVHALDGQYLLTLRVEKKLLPTAVVNKHAKQKAKEIEEQQGYKPGRKQMKDIKERIIDELLPKAFSVPRDTNVWLDTRNKWLVVETASSAKADEVMGMLSKAIDPFPVESLHLKTYPAAVMTDWLATDEPPEVFSIDQETEMRSATEEKATVKYVRQSVDASDVMRHIQAGKRVTRLALTWNSRISFVITDNLDIKRVAPLDVLKKESDSASNAEERFDGEFTLMTGELSKVIAELVAACGGEHDDA